MDGIEIQAYGHLMDAVSGLHWSNKLSGPLRRGIRWKRLPHYDRMCWDACANVSGPEFIVGIAIRRRSFRRAGITPPRKKKRGIFFFPKKKKNSPEKKKIFKTAACYRARSIF